MGRAMEGMLAVFAQLENDVRTARTTQGMIARTEQGGWVHDAPPGYKKAKTPAGVPTLEPSELAPNVTKLLTLYSKGGYTVAQAVDLAFELGIKTKTGKPRSWQSIRNILGNPLYAGFINTKFTDGKTIKGMHKPLISEEVYYRIQGVLKGVDHNFSRSAEADWVLRGGFLIHSECGHPLTGSSPKGRSGPSPRYHCIKCKASEINKPVSKKREVVHTEFMQLLSDIRPDEGTTKLFKEIVLRRWNDAYKESRELTRNLHAQIEAGLTRKSRLTDLFLDGKIGEEEFNSKKDEIDSGILQLKLRFADASKEEANKEQVIDDALLFMRDPGLYWNQAPLEIKKRVQDSIFPEGITYDPAEGFGTAKLSEAYLLIKKIASEEAKNPNLVATSGLEPLTPGL
ncbi:MAG: recombinase family protein [Candidatus Doudnabacteria bacterium]|nr:recombinase family protein [Candidatus Doudnabacteria bacterium]